jgi:outer membrane receptor protein involved in Fe transport
VDFDVGYRAELDGWGGMSGILDVRLLWTHTSFLKTLGLPGSVITDLAGSANAPGTAEPADRGTMMLTWAGPEVILDVMERYYSPLRQNPNPTLIYAPSVGDLPSWFQTDINIAHDFTPAGMPVRVFLNVSNLFDARPGIFQVPGYTGSPGMNYPVVPYEDIIGRSFTLGLKLRLD